ncbi:MAG: putative 2OG-Fe(II) oxygenase [Alphaproteobacteria bacterium]
MLSPHAGMMVLFPSWLVHAVRPYRGTHTRISIAFNLSL